MKIRVYIDKSGVEKIAARRVQDLYHWNYGVRSVEEFDSAEPTESAYIFNGVLSESEAAWEYNTTGNWGEKQIIVTGDYFERRGVVCFVDGEYNTAAKEHLE